MADSPLPEACGPPIGFNIVTGGCPKSSRDSSWGRFAAFRIRDATRRKTGERTALGMNSMKIVVLDGYTLNPGDNPWSAVAALGELTVYERTPPEEIVDRIGDAPIVLTNKTPLTRATLAACPHLKYIGVLATGYNVVDVVAAREQQIPVTNVPIYGTDTVAQYVFAVLLQMIHQPVQHDQAIRMGQWQQCQDFSFWLQPLTELVGKSLGIVGYGRIGRRVAEIGRAFGMQLLIASRSRPEDLDPAAGTWLPVAELFKQADVVSLHCPQTADNLRFVNQELLAHMKPNAYLINAARGTLIDESALAAALHRGQIAGAALDVVSIEPIASDNPLLSAPRCLLTPHYAWATVEARRRLMATAAQNIADFLAGQPSNVVNR
jgi:glycerate dehydrogenase